MIDGSFGVAAIAAETSPWMVIGLGLGIVFFGLICIILLIYLMGVIFRAGEKNKPAAQTPVKAQEEEADIPNREEFIAAVSAALAEELGKDISKIRITSIKRV